MTFTFTFHGVIYLYVMLCAKNLQTVIPFIVLSSAVSSLYPFPDKEKDWLGELQLA